MGKQKNKNSQKTILKRTVTGFTLLDFNTQLIKTTYNWQKDSQKMNYTKSRNRPTHKCSIDFLINIQRKPKEEIFLKVQLLYLNTNLKSTDVSCTEKYSQIT